MKCLDCKHLNRTQCPAAFINIDGCSDFRPKTNGDRLRAMSNEELAGRMPFCPMRLDDKFPVCKGRGCKECKLDWLNSPAGNERLQDCEIAKSQDEEESECEG